MATSQMAQLLFRQYGEIADPLPSENTLAKDIEFVPTEQRSGELYTFPVRMGYDQSFTRATDHGINTLINPSEARYEDAQLQGSEIIGRGQLSYGDMTRLSATKGRTSRAYDQGIATKLANLLSGAEQARDMDLLYGPGTNGLANIGVVNAVPVAASLGVVTINIARASFIPGFWNAALGAQLTVADGSGTIRNPTAAAVVTAVDTSKCRVQLTGVQAEMNAIAPSDLLFFYGARSASMVGIQAICENTGTLFNIDASKFPQWKALSYAVGATPLSFDKVAEGLASAADNGLSDGCVLYVNPKTWTDLQTDEVALRRYVNEKGDKAAPGFAEIEYTMACGVVKIKPYHYMKQGLAFAIPTQEYHRVGSSDITFRPVGVQNEFFYQELAGQTGAEVRCYADQAVVSDAPYHTVMFTGIANTSDNTPS